MQKLKVGDKVVCNNENCIKELKGVVGSICIIEQSAFIDSYIAIVQYPNQKVKCPLEWLELYEANHDYDEITISRSQFRKVIDEHFGTAAQVLFTKNLRDVESELFGDPRFDD